MLSSDSDGRSLRRGPLSLGYSRFRWGLIGLAVGISVAFMAYFVYNARANAEQAERAAEREIRNITNVLGEQVARTLAAVDLGVLAAAVDLAEIEYWQQGADLTRISEMLMRFAAAEPAIGRLMAIDKNGLVRASSDATLPGTSFAHRAFMATVGDGVLLSVVDPPVDDGPSCQGCIAISAPVIGRDNGQYGLIVAEIPRMAFERIFKRLDSGRRSIFAIVDVRSHLVVRVPAADRGSVVSAATFPIALRAFSQNETLTERSASIDGIDRLFAFTPVPGRGWVVYGGVAPEDYLAEWRQSLQVSVPFSVLVLASVVFLILALSRHLGRVEESERSLRQSDQRYQSLVANIPGVVFQRRRLPNGRTNIVWIGAALEELFGFSAERVMRLSGGSLRAILLAEDLQRFKDAFESSARDMSAVSWIGRARHADGRILSIEVTARPRLEAAGSILWDGILLDVTDRIAADAALTTLRAQLELALANMAQGMCVCDAEQRIVVYNRRYLEIGNIEEGDVVPGTAVETVMRATIARGAFRTDKPEHLVERTLAALRAKTPSKFTIDMADGRTVEIDVQPLSDGGSVSSFTDISDREAAQEALRLAKEQAELADRSKSQFLANMSHELRTPLNAIIGFSEIMTDRLFGPLGDARYEEYARDIRESGRHLLTLINDILDLSKIEARQATLREEQVSLAEVVDACVRLVDDRAQRGNLSLAIADFDEFPPIWADRVKLKQILLNLLSNAIKFTPAGGSVGLSGARVSDGSLVVRVTDTGIGMRPQDIPTALQPFRQVESSLSRKHEGTGLGLPLTKAIVEMHGGTLAIASIPGKGTTVSFTVPTERVIDPQGLTDSMLTEAIHAARGPL
ncbi:MAG: PAS-domain containing protein [Rhodospirillales bacterium]|jgi:PAS domain S-box-containing protein